jgi:Xaa-Pro aminopeptidase
MPLLGTDLGPDFDDAQKMEPGMVLVLEPVIWDDGASGYRAEDIVAVTDGGWVPLSGPTYEPFVVER